MPGGNFPFPIQEDNLLALEALSIPWRFRLACIFAPVSMILRVLMKLRQDLATVLAIIPSGQEKS